MLDALEAGFRAYSTGQASVPPRTAARAPAGLLGAMPGWVADRGFALKAVSVFPGNGELGLPTHQGVITLFDEQDGSLLSVMDGEHITAMRTGGGAAVSTRFLARPDARTLTILGAGVQGHSHLATVPLVRDFTDHPHLLARPRPRCCAGSDRSALRRDPRALKTAIRGADVVCCCTDAREPITRYEWFDPGTHVTSVGGTFGPEVDAETIRRAQCLRRMEGRRGKRSARRCARAAGSRSRNASPRSVR